MNFNGVFVRLKQLDIRKTPRYVVRGTYVVTVLWLWQTISFIWLLFIYLFYKFVSKILLFRFFPKAFTRPLYELVKVNYTKATALSQRGERTINRINLIDLAFRNMMFKKSRSLVTIGGMAIGIAAIVFLVSIGFGLQELIIRRVARLDELKQTDVSALPGSKEKTTDQTIAKIADMQGVEKVLPQIATVAKVSIQKSVSDMAVYGVTSEYLEASAIKPIKGSIFSSNELVYEFPSDGIVAGITTEDPDSFLATRRVSFRTKSSGWTRVRADSSTQSEILGYLPTGKRIYSGESVWGELYPEATEEQLSQTVSDIEYGPWVHAEFELWDKVGCSSEEEGCVDGYLPQLDDQRELRKTSGYIAQVNVVLQDDLEIAEPDGRVLGLTTENQVLLAQATLDASDETAIATTDEEEETAIDQTSTATASAGIVELEDGWVEIASESSTIANSSVKKISLSQNAKKQAVINMAMLKVMGLDENDAIGKTFEVSFVVVGELLSDSNEKLESVPETYTVVGVVPDDKTPFFYVPFIDLRGLGIANYSQLKVITKSPDELPMVRKQIEASGLGSRSVADTVKQIDQLFVTARVLLSILGFVALSIAALGMFNTLTVSLLERTREVGLMKAMGMKSHEVRELFLTESLVMGFFGGLAGIFLGYLGGKALGLMLSVFSITKGQGFIDISYLPISFITFIFVLSLFVGIVTGVYPALRATKISALDALRYE